ncbi:MAG TPA: hypothetical protein VIK28_03310 [Sedimentisphaerales bacterium]
MVQIPAVRFVLLDLQINGVLRRELSFERQGQLSLFQVIVHPLAGVGTVESLHVIAEIFEHAELRARLRPSPATQIFRARNDPKAIALEQRGVFLL